MKDNVIRNPRGAGRKKKFTDKNLMKIIQSFMVEEYKGDINASVVAKYAQDKLLISDIRYYHFTQNDVANKEIERIKSQVKSKYVDDELQQFQNIEINTFVNRYAGNDLKLKKALFDIQEGQKSMYLRMVRLEKENKNLKNIIKENESGREDYNSQIKELKKANNNLIELVSNLRKLIDVDNQVKMCRYIWENTLIENKSLAEQYLLTLLNCKVISEKEFEILKKQENVNESEEIASSRNNIVEILAKNLSGKQPDDIYEDITMDDINKVKDNAVIQGIDDIL